MPTPYERYVRGWKRAEAETNRMKELALQGRRVDLGEQRFGFEEAQWPTEKALMEARTEELGRPPDPSGELEHWLSQNEGKTVTDFWKEKLGIQAQFRTQQPTAYDRNLELQEKNRMEFMKLQSQFGGREMFDERGMFLGSPQEREEYNRYKLWGEQFGGKGVGAGPTIGTPEFERLYQSMLKGLPPYTPVEQRPTREQYLQRIQGEGVSDKEPTTGGAPGNRQELLWMAKTQGIKKFTDRDGLKKELPWVTDEDLDWIEDNL